MEISEKKIENCLKCGLTLKKIRIANSLIILGSNLGKILRSNLASKIYIFAKNISYKIFQFKTYIRLFFPILSPRNFFQLFRNFINFKTKQFQHRVSQF